MDSGVGDWHDLHRTARALGLKKSSSLVTVEHFHHFLQTWNGKVLDI